MPITRRASGDVFGSGCQHIAFGINAEGHNHQGFASLIARRYWPALNQPGLRELGQVLTYRNRWTFHAMVCQSFAAGGFKYTPKVITRCLDRIDVPDSEEIACVMVGTGPSGWMGGADLTAILQGIDASKKRIAVYSPT